MPGLSVFSRSSSRHLAHQPNLFRGILVVCALLFAGCQTSSTDQRILVDGRINGQVVHFGFDSGSDTSLLFRPAAARLGLKVTEHPANMQAAPGKVLLGRTELCDIDLPGINATDTLGVLDVPQGIKPGLDGLLSWQTVRPNLILIDATHTYLQFLRQLPPDIATWSQFPILANQRILTLALPDEHGVAQKVLIDTGNSNGINLSPALWRTWREAHPQAPTTFESYYMPSAGLVTHEVCWADDIVLGRLHFKNVPVSILGSMEGANGNTTVDAVLGLYALTKLHLVLDGKNNVAYVKMSDAPALPFSHNRLGAIFVPSDLNNDPLIAHVLKGSPAEAAGIHNGDLLLRIGKLDVTQWRTNPAVMPITRFWEQPVGTQLDLTLERDGQEIHATPTLRDLIGPGL